MISSKKLLELRNSQSWSQEEMASILGVSRPTLAAIEKGDVSMTLDQLDALANKLGYNAVDMLSEKVLDEEKYIEVLLEFLQTELSSDNKITKTKLAKLIYLADFAWYYDHLESITGAQYRRLPQGPVPNYYFSVIDTLYDGGLIVVDIKDTAMLISLTKAGKLQSQSKLSQEEKNLIHRISHKWKGANTREIVAFTHEQLPWKVCTPGEIIPYELITQQDPKYVY